MDTLFSHNFFPRLKSGKKYKLENSRNLFSIYALPFITVLIVIKQAIHQTSQHIKVENGKFSISNEFRQGIAILPDSIYQLQRSNSGDIVFFYLEGGNSAEALGIAKEKIR